VYGSQQHVVGGGKQDQASSNETEFPARSDSDLAWAPARINADDSEPLAHTHT
jgi:hypothetical protein